METRSTLIFSFCISATAKKKKIGRNPKSDRDWKDRKRIEISRNVSKCLEMSRNVQIKKGVKSPNRKGK